MSPVGAADAGGWADIGVAGIAPWSMPGMLLWSMPGMPPMSWGAGVDEVGTGFFLAFLAGAFVAGFVLLLAAAGIVMPGMLP
ncbi:MAG: hypothetical protein BGO50_08390 [Rhodanobacter sp. 67-28]|nr:MAG: hypothetical protein ABS82_16350 [Rhodanobacter sp. SCN 67-45]OJW43201.1 MAG: hypothetical protein BGO50_08390 [Rhodanobacter sp. 67-28]